jgi:MFS family permease
MFRKDIQYYKFCGYGFLKNLRFFEAFLVLFFLEKNLNFTQIGILYALKEILANIFSIPTGILADSFGRKRSMVFSFLTYIIAFLIYYYSRNYSWLIFATIFFAFGEAFRQGTHKAMIIEYLNIHGWADQKVHYYGHTRSWSQMGSALSSLLGAAIVFYHGEYRLVFLFSTVPPLLDMLLVLSYPNSLDGELQTLKPDLIWKSFKNVATEFIVSFKKKEILKAISNLSMHTGFHKAVKDYLQPILQSFALATPFLLALNLKQRASVLVGIAYFLIFTLTAYMSHNSGKFADRHGNLPRLLNLTMIAGFAAGMISGLSLILGYIWVAIIFYIGIFLIENLRKPMGISYITDMMDRNIMATALSAESQAETLTAALIAPVMGLIADKMGIGYSLITVSGILLLSSLFYFAAGHTKTG